MKREPAWRIFAVEYNDATLEIKGSGEKVPSYVVTPLGSKVNRVFITGVLTDVESVMEGGEYLRAHLSDPTGVFTIYSGQYQQEATNKLQSIEVPAFVAVIGKVRTYIPEEGTLYVSEEKLEIKERKKESKKEQKKPKKQEDEQPISMSEAPKDFETVVLDTIKEIEDTEGAPWDSIVEKCKKQGLDENTIEEALASLMDKGFIFEPVLGTLKST